MAEQMVLTLDIAQALAQQETFRKSQRQTRNEIVKTMTDTKMSADEAAKRVTELGAKWQMTGAQLSKANALLSGWDKTTRVANVSQGLMNARIQQAAFAFDDFFTVFQTQTNYMNAFIMGSRSMSNNLSFILSTIQGLNPLWIVMPSLLTAVGGSMAKAFLGGEDAAQKTVDAAQDAIDKFKELQKESERLQKQNEKFTFGPEGKLSPEGFTQEEMALLVAANDAVGQAGAVVGAKRQQKFATTKEFQAMVNRPGGRSEDVAELLGEDPSSILAGTPLGLLFGDPAAKMRSKMEKADTELLAAQRGELAAKTTRDQIVQDMRKARDIRRIEGTGLLDQVAAQVPKAMQIKGAGTKDDIVDTFAPMIAQAAGVPETLAAERIGRMVDETAKQVQMGKMGHPGQAAVDAGMAGIAQRRDALQLDMLTAELNAPNQRLTPMQRREFDLREKQIKLDELKLKKEGEQNRMFFIRQNAND